MHIKSWEIKIRKQNLKDKNQTKSDNKENIEVDITGRANRKLNEKTRSEEKDSGMVA